MKRFAFCATLSIAALSASLVLANAEIETFDSPNELQSAGGNYTLIRDTGSYITANGAVQTFNASNYELSTVNGYGSGYHNIFTQDSPPPGSGLTNGVENIGGDAYLQLDVTINNGTDAGIFVDLYDGEQTDAYKYFFGYGRSGNAVNDTAAGLQPGEIITQGALPNEEIMDVPLATPFQDIFGSGTFDFTQLVTYRIEDDPGAGAASDVSYYDLSAVNLPEPAGFGIAAAACLLAARRRRS